MAFRVREVQSIGLSSKSARHEVGQLAGIRHIAVMEEKPRVRVMRVGIDVIDAFGVESAGPADEAMDFVPFG